MAVEWTAQQKQIIDLRDRNILVAAAAGSGKTAVLVERILSMITDKAHPVDIDRLLVVTFTNAAAGQMKERIGKQLALRLLENPQDRNLKRQEDLLPHAKIMTIDSFCLYIVRNYFSFLDLDPDFRIGDEGELKLLREKVMKELLEEQYKEGSPDFILFVESYAEGKGDGGIPEYIERLYQFASAYPEPEKQLLGWEEQLKAESAEDLDSSEWMKCLMDEIHLEALELKKRYEAAIEECLSSDGPYYYESMFQSDKRLAEGLLSASSYEAAAEIFAGIKKAFVRKPSKKDQAVSEEKKAFLSALRDEMKKTLQDMAKQYYLGDMKQVLADIEGCRRPLTELIRLALLYGSRYGEAKRKKNLVDFGDVEHFALQILTEEAPDGSGKRPSQAAVSLSKSFHEIMIDEYQDSNRIQEEILTSVSRERDGLPNVFMVGDVKQSIYKFRQARPELFMEKYASYTVTDSRHQKIDLHRNFRSRSEVLETVNFLFRQLMEQKMGGITYDEAAALVPGRSFPALPDGEEGGDFKTEILLLNSGRERAQEKEVDAKLLEYQTKELEAKSVAKRIKELVDPVHGQKIYDNDTGMYRTAGYGDIVVLLRTMTGWAEVFAESLTEAGIPAYAQTRTGYFTAREVQCVLQLLQIIDNPMQDIPLAAVMKSPIGDFTSEELALLTAQYKQSLLPKTARGLYGAVKFCLEQEEKDQTGKRLVSAKLQAKVKRFCDMICDFREKAVYMRLHKLLHYILEKTEYEYILAAMPGGRLRLANIEMLIKQAVDYENTSYQGVFHFVRYIENLQKYSVDFGEASLSGEREDTVRITSIHKSKGLEYPIVILAGAGKPFNQGDSKGKILFHPDLGVAADYIDTKNRLRAATLPKKVFARQLRLENLGEELRILYVALTRAEEKLIITGTDKYLENKLIKWNSLRLEKNSELPYGEVTGASSYLDWILMAFTRSCAYGEILSERGITPPVFHPLYEMQVPAAFHVESTEGLVRHETVKQVSNLFKKERLLHWEELERSAEEKALADQIESRLSYAYPFQAAVSAPGKFSVSRLKEIGMEKESLALFTEQEEALTLEEEPVKETGTERKLPGFLKEEEALTGAARGTAYHKVLELLPFTTAPVKAEIEAALGTLERAGLLPENTKSTLNLWKIKTLLASPLGRRMAEGERKGTLRKEQQFVMGVPAERISPEYKCEGLLGEQMLIQGIIDAWFEEEDGLVLVDYKTDRIDPSRKEASKQVLISRYQTQLDYYQEALEKSTGKRVKERYLYSFGLEEAIPL